MNLNKLILALIGICLISCEQNSKDLKTVFPDNTTKTEKYIASHKYLIIVRINENDCTPCALNDLNMWKLYKNIFDKYNIGILVVLPTATNQNSVESLQCIDIPFHIVFDEMNKFKVKNDKIFRVARDGVFVIDKDKNVIFTGSPITTEEKWNAFMNLVNENEIK
jgi:hypothetical protein